MWVPLEQGAGGRDASNDCNDCHENLDGLAREDVAEVLTWTDWHVRT